MVGCSLRRGGSSALIGGSVRGFSVVGAVDGLSLKIRFDADVEVSSKFIQVKLQANDLRNVKSIQKQDHQ